MNISSIASSINSLGLVNNNSETKSVDNSSFESMLTTAISDVNQQQIEGYNAMEGIATGKVSNLQEAVKQIEEAELSLKLALETKTKALSAYKEIMNMQI